MKPSILAIHVVAVFIDLEKKLLHLEIDSIGAAEVKVLSGSKVFGSINLSEAGLSQKVTIPLKLKKRGSFGVPFKVSAHAAPRTDDTILLEETEVTCDTSHKDRTLCRIVKQILMVIPTFIIIIGLKKGDRKWILLAIFDQDHLNDGDGSSIMTERSRSCLNYTREGVLGTRECSICLTRPRDTLFLPCRHMSVCEPCAGIYSNQAQQCPICRQVYQSIVTLVT